MFKKLKKRFVFASTISLTIIITIIVIVINTLNFINVISESDDILTLLHDNQGRFPTKPGHVAPGLDLDLTPESPYESRYFSVELDGGKVVRVYTESIKAVDDEAAIKMAKQSMKTAAKRGFIGNYRYLIHKDGERTTVIFLDCTRQLNNCASFLFASISGSILCIFIIFLIIQAISGRMVRPIVEGYEKQKQFITNAGHDLKTPITIMNADAELIEMEFGESEWLDDIKKQTARMSDLTGELIYLARMEEMESIPHMDFPISDVAEEIMQSFSAPAKTKNIKLVSSIQPALFMRGDEESIRKLFIILIDNAVKYSQEGDSVELSVKKQGRNILIKVTNKATNLSDESIKHMFERFYRSDKARSSDGGFGIGLSVANAIVASHKGKISAEKADDYLHINIIL